MAKCTISNGIETITGALKKTTEQVPKLCESGVSKRKVSVIFGRFFLFGFCSKCHLNRTK